MVISFQPRGSPPKQMLQIYLDTEQYAQAITLAREAIVSKVCECHGYNSNRDSDRRDARDMLNRHSSKLEDYYIAQYDGDTLAQLWSEITKIRNDVNHAGMRNNAKSSVTLIPAIKVACCRTCKFITSQPKRST